MIFDDFSSRHIGPSDKDIKKMLDTMGLDSIEKLLNETIPETIRLKHPLKIPNGIGEHEFAREIRKLSEENKIFDCYIGLGYNPTILPGVIQRNILENPGWYTSYTPYQAEIAQGRLEALFNFQTMVCDLTKMDLANASLLDEGTAAAEAMIMLFNNRNKEKKLNDFNYFYVDKNIFPQTLSILETRSNPLGIKLIIEDLNKITFNKKFFGGIFQYPGKNGKIEDLNPIIKKFKEKEINTIVAADLLSLTIINPPGEMGVDVVVGSTQRFGIPMGYGGPHAAFFATKEIYKRNIPGRIIGETIDLDNRKALRMALQTREQHIKRDRATSNICTAQVLLAIMAGMYAVYHGPKGLKHIAKKIHEKSVNLSDIIKSLGIKQMNDHFFDTIMIKVNSKTIRPIAESKKINFNYVDDKNITISLNETTTINDLNKIISVFEEYTKIKNSKKYESIDEKKSLKIHSRKSKFLMYDVFNSYHTETSLMRYIKYLEKKDLSLNHSMISLGSCTMKLNAASEMFPLSSFRWNNLHPFVPISQAGGYKKLLSKLEEQLTIITGFDSTSLQPNSGAQGEYAGLMVIRAYHNSKGETNRNICLIPASAHGTNPASAIMAGMKVVVVKTDKHGNIDWNDINEKAKKFKKNLSTLMITYPSTHGVFESKIKLITKLIHDYGGQVYMDGANMNAQVGLTSPAIIGADVCHLNLHKTFAIPHGGGGPGVGPICVAKHLSEFLPGNPIIKVGGKNSISAISSAPYGSSLACIISYAYIKLLGGEGLKKATEIAILNANYIKKRLDGDFKILYKGEINGRNAHELIIDCRDFRKNGIEVNDIAKRLIDYGFHAPTVSFPVSGTMMIEPTESENLEEIDRFCDALISIKKEINKNTEKTILLLKNAPHTLKMVTSDKWEFPYSRAEAAFPLPYLHKNKFWPSVRRVDEAHGDRNLICSCIEINDFINN
ncbi:MAG: glycine dehydrogenase (aminomethyl-transferring) [Flavobacteriaceae bacterium]|nr:glycine dehydrogenase (aminomethyl-transferring) [Flavobacteriaceae bacterium]|tara:strand:+ start:46692 stop:49541 length:2850 start_codon:yes stop_codon:yes gene_type:complete